MKKLKFLALLIMCACIFAGCENSNEITVAYLSNATSAGSDDYSVKISFQQDDRVEEKYYDIQIMSDVENLSFTFFREGDGQMSATISQKDRWNSLTSLIYSSMGQEGRETFSRIKDAVDVIYVFNVEQPAKLFFRVVAGEVEDNAEGTGQILANTQPVSEDFVLNCG